MYANLLRKETRKTRRRKNKRQRKRKCGANSIVVYRRKFASVVSLLAFFSWAD